MKYYLAKTDPQSYSIDDLKKDIQVPWSGVRNPQAVLFLKAMKPGDLVLIYHSQGQAAIVGLAEVVGMSRPDPQDLRSWLVDFKFIRTFKQPYVTLQQIKATGKFPDFRLVRQSRLSTMDVPGEVIKWLQEHGLNITLLAETKTNI